jgi:glutathione S-transferase
MKLYGFPASPNTWKVRATAHQLGVPLELEIVDLTKGAQRKPEYLAINGDFNLWESAAIMQYLGTKKNFPMWPDHAKVRADIMRWQSWHLQHWSRGVTPYIFENLAKAIMKIGPPDPKALAAAGEIFHPDAAMLDKHLGSREWLVGDAMTLADFTVVAPLVHAESGKIPLEKYSNIKRWMGNLLALPAWRETAPQR